MEHRKLLRSDNVIPDYDYLFSEEVQKNGKKKNKFFSKLLRANKWTILLSIIVYCFQVAPVFAMPIITSNLINKVSFVIASGQPMTFEIWKYIAINAVVLFVIIVQNVPSTRLFWKIFSKMLRSTSAGIKTSVIKKLQSLSISYHKDMQTGRIQSKFLKDTDNVDNLFHMLAFSLIPNIITTIVAIIISVINNGIVSLFFLVVIPINVGVTYMFRSTIRKKYKDYRVKTEKMSVKLSTMLNMMTVTKAHGLEQTEINSVSQSINNLKGSGLDMDKVNARFGAWSWVINTLLSATCVVFCSVLALKKIINVGDIVLFQSMFTTISGHVSGLIGMFPQLASGFESLHSVSEIMNAKDVEINSGKKIIPDIDGEVEFKNVSYMYPDGNQYVVKDFNLKVNKGECIAVVGSSGSGKSTIMNLIIGFLLCTEGQILIDGKDIKELNLSEYRHHISVVPQNSILFDGSIKENIVYGLTSYTDEQIEKVVEMANLKEFVDELPDKLDTKIGEHGDKLSGGQKQRITIARALIRNPKILILDEATSALDNISEYHVQKAISSSIKGRTTFVVAHRLSTIRDADRIVVMENGIAVEMGTYNELMDKKGKFYELKCLNDLNLQTAEKGLE